MLLLLSALAGLTTEPLVGQRSKFSDATSIAVRSDSRLWLEGGSNVRDWKCKATAMEANVAFDNASPVNELPVVRGAFVKVPVRMLKCGDRHMEAHMYTALKAPSPTVPAFIIAQLDGLPVTDSVSRNVEVTGMLSIAGVSRHIRMTVHGDRLADKTLHARGALPILMTDYGVLPPRPWGGILRTAIKVVIQFEIFVDPPRSKTSTL